MDRLVAGDDRALGEHGVAAIEVADRFRALPIPFIAGGLIRTPDIVKRLIAAGCSAVSTTNVKLWEMNVGNAAKGG